MAKAVLISIRPEWVEKIANEWKTIEVRKSNMKPLRTFESINDAERLTGIPTSNIVACLKGRQSYTRDVRWRYVEELQ